MRMFLVFSFLFISTTVFAAQGEPSDAVKDSPSASSKVVPEFFYEPPQGTSAAKLLFRSRWRDMTEYANQDSKRFDKTIREQQYEISAFHTFTGDFSIYGSDRYVNTDTHYAEVRNSSYSLKSVGVGDFYLGAQKIFLDGQTGYVIGLDLAVSPGNGRFATTSTPGLPNSGGTSYAPFIGIYDGDIGSNTILGASFKYVFQSTRLVNSSSTPSLDETVTGGDEWTLSTFGQQRFGRLAAEILLQLNFQQSQNTSVGGSSPATNTADAYSAFRAAGALYFYMNRQFTFAATADAIFTPERNVSATNDYEGDTEIDGTASVRFAFD